MRFQDLRLAVQVYVIAVVVLGAYVFVAAFPLSLSQPLAFLALLAASCWTSVWKVQLVLPAATGSTLSVSYAANLMALLLLGADAALVVAVGGAWAQCTFRVRERFPVHQTIFSMAAEAVTMHASGMVYVLLSDGQPLQMTAIAKPVVAAISTYFVVNTGLVAGAVALSSRQPVWKVWYDNFLWSGPSFMVAGGAGAFAAVVVTRGEYRLGILLFAPVYLTYRTYSVYLGRIESERRHVAEERRMHAETVDAFVQVQRAERALADETERLTVTFSSIADGVITIDKDRRITLLNPAAETLTQWTHGEALDKPLGHVFRTLDRQSRQLFDLFADAGRRGPGHGVRPSALLVARDLTERPIEGSSAPLRDSTGHVIGAVLVFRDISDALRVQAERARADKLSSLGLLAGGIAHDFNNILMAIIGHVSQARMVLPPDEPALSGLTEAEEACDRARQLTWRLLTVSRGEAATKTIVTLRQPLEESVRLALRGTSVRCVFDIDAHLWPVEADETQLVQLFTNILINAQQAMPDGGTISVRAGNTIERRPHDDFVPNAELGAYLEIAIADEGAGIAPEHLGRIFDPYFTTKLEGNGLGLATAHSIIKNHGGFVTVASIVGRGTTMHVYLPAALPDTRSEESGVSPRARERRILVMEHDPAVRVLVADMLQALGYKPDVVGSGVAAVERYQHALASGQPYEAVILDLVVPEGIGGKEAMERLGRIDRKVTAILASGYSNPAMTRDVEQLGFKAVLAKPYTLAELSRTLRSVIATPSHRIH